MTFQLQPWSKGSAEPVWAWAQGIGSKVQGEYLQVWEAWQGDANLLELKGPSLVIKKHGTERKCGHVGSLPPSPSLAPLTELNELSTLSVLEESSWERARGQGEEGVRLGEGKRQRQRI